MKKICKIITLFIFITIIISGCNTVNNLNESYTPTKKEWLQTEINSFIGANDGGSMPYFNVGCTVYSNYIDCLLYSDKLETVPYEAWGASQVILFNSINRITTKHLWSKSLPIKMRIYGFKNGKELNIGDIRK